jgi:hypothetical protein
MPCRQQYKNCCATYVAVNNINIEIVAMETRQCFLLNTVALHVAVKNTNIESFTMETQQ